MERDVRFCTTEDGVRIAYCVDGSGPDLVCCPDFIGSFALDSLIEDQMGFWRALWAGRRVVRYDVRGTGLSQRDVRDVSHEALVRDLDAVVKAAGARDFTLYASTLSGPRAIAYAVRKPALVRRLILHRTFSRAVDIMSEEQARNFADMARINWPMAAQVFADLPVRQELPDAGVHQARLYTQSTNGELVARLLLQGYETTDVTPLLSELRVPVLVMHRRDDSMFSFRLAQALAAAIPGARLVPLQQGVMNLLAEGRIGEVIDVLNEFIDDGTVAAAREPRATAGSVQAVLFTDLVGHTEMMRRLGDDAGRDVLREHERITRATLRDFGGAEIKAMGDGFMASFNSITRATECAVAIQRAFAARTGEPLDVRVGLDAGEPIEEDGDLFGSTVILALRIAARAGAGEILISDTMRGLLSGKKFLLSDRGEIVLKGFEDGVRLYEVGWRA